MDKFKKQLNKGVLELSILKLLTEDNQYGYSIMEEIGVRSNQKLKIKDGTLYPILYRLEDQKIIESYWKTEEAGRSKPRKYYRLTKNGMEYFENMLSAYLEITSGMKNILKWGYINEERKIYKRCTKKYRDKQ